MEIKRNKRTTLTFLILFSLVTQLNAYPNQSYNSSQAAPDEFQLGVILDMGSWVGKSVHSCINMAISDFYAVHSHYKTRIVILTSDSHRDPLTALSSAIDLWNNNVQAIMGPTTFHEATFLAVFGNKTKVPFFSFSASPSSVIEYPYLFRITPDEPTQFQAIASIVVYFKWNDVIVIYEDTNYGRETFPYMVESFLEKNIKISHSSAISLSASDAKILEDLHKLMAVQITIFVVHMSPSLASRLFLYARRLGMVSEKYAWIITDKTMNLIHTMDSEVIESLQGVLGLKSYVPASDELRNFTLRWRKEYYNKYPTMEAMNLSVFGILAYDAIWALAKAVERIGVQIPRTHKPGKGLNFTNLAEFQVSQSGKILLNEISQIRFKGLSGEYQLKNGRLVSRAFEIVNLIGTGERRVGFWTMTDKIMKEMHTPFNGRHQHSSTGLEVIIWPGGSTTPPKGWLTRMSYKKLRIGYPLPSGTFTQFVNIDFDNKTNKTTLTGICIEIFNAFIEALPYDVAYDFIPFEDAKGNSAGTYNDLVHQVYLQNFDAVIGDITITANRSQYVDFTLPYTDLGVGMIAKIENKDMWFFLKPLDADLWLTSLAFFIVMGLVIWVIEHSINGEFQGSPAQQIGTVFWFTVSTLVFAERERLSSNLSKFILVIWVFVVLILSSCYTATLSSLLTVQQIQLASKGDNIGYQVGSFLQGVTVNNVNFTDYSARTYYSIEEYDEALSKGSKNGGVSAIIDEIPYIQIFLAKYSDDYTLVSSESTTNGFAFAFQKGSPLTSEMSREIVKLREGGQLKMMEDKWYKSHSSLLNHDSSSKIKTLNVDNFRGLFLVSGVSLALAILLFIIYFLRENFRINNYIVKILSRGLATLTSYFFPINGNVIPGN